MASFEQQLVELEKVLERLERGDLSLEENVTLFERGVQLSDDCKRQLSAAESRVQVLLDPRERGPVKVGALAMDASEEGDDAEENFTNDAMDADDEE